MCGPNLSPRKTFATPPGGAGATRDAPEEREAGAENAGEEDAKQEPRGEQDANARCQAERGKYQNKAGRQGR